MDNKIYSISDEILDNNNSDCIIYDCCNNYNMKNITIDDFLDIEDCSYVDDEYCQEFIKI